MSTPDQLRVAELDGHARYCINHRVSEAEAIAGLHQITERPDLLAQAAGIIIGATNQRLRDWSQRRAYARLLIIAGADRTLLPRWVAQGRENALRGARNSNETWPYDAAQLLAEALEGLADE